ncbi:MAG: extensin-like domain-containing protein [Rhodoplanes sp.]|jgi:Extensin-like protein C-terminus
MTRDVRLYLVGSLALVLLAGCGRNFFAQRESWRREAEVQCLKSGSVKEGPAIAMLSPIEGPGICGADFPFKVVALGDTPMLGYADEPIRPPGAIRGGARRPDPLPPATYPNEPRPLDLAPPGAASGPDEDPDARGTPSYGAPAYGGRGSQQPSITQSPLPPPGAAASPYPPRYPSYGESVPISPSREAPLATRTAAATITPAATLACPVVSALDRWVAEAIQPAAQRWFGQPVVEIKQISAYSCRGMNGNPRARISEHAFGNALDISAFVLADGHVVTIRRGWAGTPEEQGFLRDVQSAACNMFSTVLAPGSNRFHYDHIHVDLMRRESGRQVCEPAAIPGEVVAARARARGGYVVGRPRDPGVTGSIAPRPRAEIGRSRHPAARFDDDRDSLSAVPGED